MRDLRNKGGEVLDRVVAGEQVTVTRDGVAVAQLRPVPGTRLDAHALVERFRRLPPVDAVSFRADVDGAIDQSI